MARQVSKQDYFDAALRLLAVGGSGRLKLGPLCSELGVSTGSFYHYFAGLPNFRTELLDHWVAVMTTRYGELATAEGDPARRAVLLIEFVCALPHDAEAAIRAWSRSDDEVNQAQKRVDDLRMNLAIRDLTLLLGDHREAWETAHLGLCVLIGFQDYGGGLDVDFLRRNLARLLPKDLVERWALEGDGQQGYPAPR